MPVFPLIKPKFGKFFLTLPPIYSIIQIIQTTTLTFRADEKMAH